MPGDLISPPKPDLIEQILDPETIRDPDVIRSLLAESVRRTDLLRSLLRVAKRKAAYSQIGEREERLASAS